MELSVSSRWQRDKGKDAPSPKQNAMIKADAREPQERSAPSPGRNLFLTALPFLMAEHFPAAGIGRLGTDGLLL